MTGGQSRYAAGPRKPRDRRLDPRPHVFHNPNIQFGLDFPQRDQAFAKLDQLTEFWTVADHACPDMQEPSSQRHVDQEVGGPF